MPKDQDLVDWLLESSVPSIRHATMTKLLPREASHPQVQTEREQIMLEGPVPAILEGQTGRGDWQPEQSYYTPKYTSTHWSMHLLAELAADGTDARLQRGAEHMLKATESEAEKNVSEGAYGLSCFWGNVLRYTLHCGFAGDPRVDRMIEYMVRDAVEHQWRCKHNWELPCAWGAARALFGFASIPPGERSPSLKGAIQKGLDFLLTDLVSRAGQQLLHDLPNIHFG